MPSVNFVKDISGIKPLGSDDYETLKKIPLGSVLECEFSKKRNPQFHRKFFALLNLGYEYWEPEQKEWKGHKATKNFDVYRENITILAGFFDATYKINGDVKLIAKSISFAAMDDIEFEKLYKQVFIVIWEKVLHEVFEDTAQMENAVNQLLSFS